MNNYQFVTLFDKFYLYRGLALARSLKNTCPAARLFVICLDDITFKILSELHLANVFPIAKDEFENKELLALKNKRNNAEYCWTCTPASVKYVLEKNPDIDMLTYLDADLFFFAPPDIIFDETTDCSVLITEHRFRKNIKWNEYYNGRFNVQYLTFKNNPQGLKTLNWWYDKCIEWCYDRHEAERYGDQKYLDKWPEIFDGVKILENIATCLAPWNLLTHKLSSKSGLVMVDERTPLVFYHFQSLKIFSENAFNMAVDYRLRREDRELIYLPYLLELQNVITKLKNEYPQWKPQFDQLENRNGFFKSLKFIKRKFLLKDNYFTL
ncbi:MAG: hypothetical protein UT30_C0017G0027 [Candidatus Uhrbacteria bacterium GW2011_GWF2_39_13]|uniref:Glycosyl transferase n=1 Tax=Candidatus Uhrbacteria bacterium GW2011_GWF2_39_13 TaxID=1618995 RepID=A0A0G0ML53_9BACT|nr:MAG: hypothetical protein UT30_C0017G0027 [Candidatus Uhrbacteria bacterium GW2011_GWF2_39_13]